MGRRSDILDSMSRARLVELAKAAGIEGLTSSRKPTIRDALVRLRRLADAELLDLMKRDDLKAACRSLGLDDSGRARRPIIDRLLDVDGRKTTRRDSKGRK